MGKQEGLIIASFYKKQNSKTKALEVCAMARVEPGGHSYALVEKEGRSLGQKTWSENSLGHIKRETSSLGVHLGEVVLLFRRQTRELLCSLAYEQRCWLGQLTWMLAFAVFTINSKPLHVLQTALLGQIGTSHSSARCSSRGSA